MHILTRFRVAAVATLVVAVGALVYGDLLTEVARTAYPTTVFRTGTVAFDAGTRRLDVDGTPIRTIFPVEVARPHGATPPSTVAIRSLVLNPSATSVAGAGSPDFELVGSVDVDGDGSISAAESGVMLTGNLVEVAYTNPAPSVGGDDRIAFRFSPTGGFLTPFYAGRNIGVDVYFTNNGAWPAPPTPGADFATSFLAAVRSAGIKPIPCATQIGDFVWHDQDGDGIQDPGEPGLSDVTVRLKDAAGNVIATTQTRRGPFNQGGYFLFEKIDGFCAGTYTVEVDETTLPAGFFPTAINASGDPATDSDASPATVVLGSDIAQDLKVDFGYTNVYDGRIAGRVWHDLNGNGLQDADEPGLDKVTVNLYDSTGLLIATNQTIAGDFGFGGLAAGDYRLKPDSTTIPDGFEPTISDAGPDDIDSDLPAAFVSLTPSVRRIKSVGFGFVSFCAGTIGDFVWYDKNQDGKQDPGETGLSGIDVSLLAADGSVVGVTSTGADGAYSFTGVCAGTYQVVVDQADVPPGFMPTAVGTNPDDAFDSNPIPATVVMPANDNKVSSIDFGFIAPCSGSIGDRVWLDENQNGIQDAGEGNVAGVTVNLRRRSDYSIIQTDITGADGLYLFTGLCPGRYNVEVVPADGVTISAVGQGAPDLDSNANPELVELVLDDSSDLTVDWGLSYTGQIGDFVWNDLNGNGKQEDGEPGLQGVVVTLTESDGDVRNTVTNAAGFYVFTGLPAGTYVVSVATPGGFTPTLVQANDQPERDSNANPSTVVLDRSDRKIPNIDFGFVAFTPPPTTPPSISVTKAADKLTVVYGESVTFTYVVTNTGGVTLTNVVVRDDNATPNYAADDFVVGTIASMPAGASQTFTATRIPPAKMCNSDSTGNTRQCGVMVFEKHASSVHFTYLQSKDHRGDFDNGYGWQGDRSYAKKGKFRVSDIWGLASDDVTTDSEDLDSSEFASAFHVTANNTLVSWGERWVNAPRIFHKKGWDGDWRQDWDWRYGNLFRWGRWDDDWSGRNNDEDYDYEKHPRLCPTTSTNIVVVTATAGDTSVSDTDKATVEIVAPPIAEGFKTFTQGGWGSKPSGNNPGRLLAVNFDRVFPSGSVIIGGTRTIKLIGAVAVERFLPQGGTPARLTKNYINPTTQITVLAGQVAALKLNVEFSAAGVTRPGLGNLTVVSGELQGRTVAQVLAMGNSVLGGGALPSGLTLSELNDIIARINGNFDGGQNNGYLVD